MGFLAKLLRTFGKGGPSPGEALRQQALTADISQIGAASSPNEPLVLMMEMGLGIAAVSLVVVADGSVSLYMSRGSSIIGAGEHSVVRQEGMKMLEYAGKMLSSMAAEVEHPLPRAGKVRFVARTRGGDFAREESEADLRTGAFEFAELYAIGHAVIALIREASSKSAHAQ